jgi:hypothetical protein
MADLDGLASGLGVTSLIEALGRCTFIAFFRSGVFQIGEPCAPIQRCILACIGLVDAAPLFVSRPIIATAPRRLPNALMWTMGSVFGCRPRTSPHRWRATSLPFPNMKIDRRQVKMGERYFFWADSSSATP